MIQFGAGAMFAHPVGANVAANPTPIEFGTLQDLSLEFNATSKPLFGRNSFPVRVARGATKITGKAKSGRINGKVLNDLFFGQNLVAGGVQATVDEGPFTIAGTATVAGSANFVQDLGVNDGSIPFVAVASAPTAGQYSVAAGVYTFAAADAGRKAFISYSHSIASLGLGGNIINTPMGSQPQFEIVTQLSDYLTGTGMYLKLNACVASKLTLATKLEDYTMPEIDFEAFADNNNIVGNWYFGD